MCLQCQIMNIFKIRYFTKNFRQEMNIKDNITIKGIIKRTQRMYPRATKFFKTAFMISISTMLLLFYFPGSMIPFQRQFKLFVYKIGANIDYFHYMNKFDPKPQDYLLVINEQMIKKFNSQLVTEEIFQKYIDQMAELFKEHQKIIKQGTLIDLMVYFNIYLDKIIKFDKKKLISKEIKDGYFWLFQNAVKKINLDKIIFKEDGNKIMFIYSLMCYTLRYLEEGQIDEILNIYLNLIKRKEESELKSTDIWYIVAKRGLDDRQFKNILKQTYTRSNKPVKQKILQIFKIYDQVYKNEEFMNLPK